MTTPITFLAHATTGLLASADSLTINDDLEATVNLTVRALPSGTDHTLSQNVSFLLPCDVLGISPDAIRRCDPDHRTHNTEFEPNYLAAVEFVAPDLPWRFTTDQGSATERRPWIALVVLADGEFELTADTAELTDDTSGTTVMRPAALRVLQPSALPPVNQTGQWAHVQARGAHPNPSADQMRALDEADPLGLISRLVAARRLAATTSYTAFVVPTSECGRQRGLDPLGSHTHSPGLAWENPNPGLELPYYFSWSFATSTQGDIEALAERLVPRGLDPLTGTVPLQVGPQTYGIPAANPPRRYEGALVSTELPDHVGQNADQTTRLIEVLNRPAELATEAGADITAEEPGALAPPIYGGWHRRQTTVQAVGPDHPDWVSRMNTQLHLRAAAGLGAEVVRRDQEALAAEAWRQIGDVTEAERRLCAAQLGLLTSGRLHDRVKAAMPAERVVMWSGPVHAKLTAGTTTLLGALAPSGLGGPTQSIRLRSLLATRPAREAWAGGNATTAVVASQATSSKPNQFDDEIHDPAMTAAVGQAQPDSGPGGTGGAAGGGIGLNPVLGEHVEGGIRLTGDAGARGNAPSIASDGGDVVGLGGVTNPGLHAGDLGGIAFDPGRLDPGLFDPAIGGTDPGTGGLFTDLDDLRNRILEALDPAINIPARLNALIEGITISTAETLCDPPVPAPQFTRPMYEPLRELSVSYLLPGIGDIPPNTAALLAPNSRFIEAYLTGLNHEMAAELLWRGYPTDLRGSYFPHFWETAGQDAGAAALDTWTAPLGINTTQGAVPLVLLLRGDLIRRYPGIAVYAQRAIKQDEQILLGSDTIVPSFRAELTVDTVAIGFDGLDEEAARGDENDPGWFFVLEERPRDVRLGLDVPTGAPRGRQEWNEVTWADVAPAEVPDPRTWQGPIDLDDVPATPLPAPPAGPIWGSGAAAMSQILFQQPFRIAMHARRLLPENTQP